MNNIEKQLKLMEKITAPSKEVEQTINQIVEQEERIRQAFQTILDQITRNSEFYQRASEEWQNSVRQNLALMAKSGWYPNSFTFDFEPKKNDLSVDELMEEHLVQDWERITKKITELYPKRAHILSVAFSLHSEKNYIASIPLFLTQADGICNEVFGIYLFDGNKVAKKIDSLDHEGKIDSDIFADAILNLFSLENHYNARINEDTAKEKAPNRNGILHGASEHLDYGTRRNSLKALSLLSFVVFAGTFVKSKNADPADVSQARRYRS